MKSAINTLATTPLHGGTYGEYTITNSPPTNTHFLNTDAHSSDSNLHYSESETHLFVSLTHDSESETHIPETSS